MFNFKTFLIFFCTLLSALTVLDAANKNEPSSSKGSGFKSKAPIGQRIKAGVSSVKEKGSVLSSQFASGAKDKMTAGVKDVKNLMTPFSYKKSQFLSNFRIPPPWQPEPWIQVNKDRLDIFEESLNLFNKYLEEVRKKMKKPDAEILKSKGLTIQMGTDYGNRITQKWITMLANGIINKHEYFEFPNAISDVIEINTKNRQTRTEWYQFFGRITALAIINRKILPVCFSIPFLKTMLNREIILNDLKDVRPIYFSTISEACKVQNKKEEFIRSSIKQLYGSQINRQMDAFMKGFNELVPHRLIEPFSADELNKLICGSAITQDNVSDWVPNISYDTFHDRPKKAINRLWDVIKEFNTVELEKFLMFITGVPRVPPGGFIDIGFRVESISKKACKLRQWTNTLDLRKDADKDQLASELKNKMANLDVPIPIHRV